MDESLEKKYSCLLKYIIDCSSFGIAFSGGVDSTLLVHAAIDAAGSQTVKVFHAVTPLISKETTEAASGVIKKHFSEKVDFIKVHVDLMAKDQIRGNHDDRCYVCKKEIYEKLLSKCRNEGITFLFDGTNMDDLGNDRPGFRAIKELGIKTPFLHCHIGKSDIREIAGTVGLSNALLPSDSCLATRLEKNVRFDLSDLAAVDSMERFLKQRGFSGYRVKPRKNSVILELTEEDTRRVVESEIRKEITSYFRDHGFEKLYIDLLSVR